MSIRQTRVNLLSLFGPATMALLMVAMTVDAYAIADGIAKHMR